MRFNVAQPTPMDLSAWGCLPPEDDYVPPPTRTPSTSTESPTIRTVPESPLPSEVPTPGVIRMPTPMQLPTRLRRSSPPPHNSSMLGAALAFGLQYRSGLTYLLCCALLLYRFGTDPAVVLPLLCMAVTTVVCSEQAASDAFRQRRPRRSSGEGGSGGGVPRATTPFHPWYSGSVAHLGNATLKRFGRAAFYCGTPGSTPCSPQAVPIVRTHSPPIPGISRQPTPAIARTPSAAARSTTAANASAASAASASPSASAAAGGASDLPPAEDTSDLVSRTLHTHESVDLDDPNLVVDPTEVMEALHSVLALAEAHQWLDAGLALRALDAAVSTHPTAPHVLSMQQELRMKSTTSRAVQTVRSRYAECLDTLKVLSAGEDVWQLSQEFRNVRTHYKHDDAGRLWLRTEGVMPDVSMLECVAMWKEADLFKQWFPLCTDSVTLAEQGRVELLAWMQLAAPGVPIGKRDAVLHGFGVDALADGFMMIIGKSAKQSDFPEVVFPPLRGFGSARMHVQGLQVLIAPLSETAVRCAYVVHIDMMMPLPGPVIKMATERVVGMIFHKLMKEARRIRLGTSESPHAERMEKNVHIYTEWMRPRMLEALHALGLAPPPPPPPPPHQQQIAQPLLKFLPDGRTPSQDSEYCEDLRHVEVPPTPSTSVALRRREQVQAQLSRLCDRNNL